MKWWIAIAAFTLVVLANAGLFLSGRMLLLSAVESPAWIVERDLLVENVSGTSARADQEPITLARCTYWNGLGVRTLVAPRQPAPAPLCPGPVT